MDETDAQKVPAPLRPVERMVGRPVPERDHAGVLTVHADPVADALDDLAALGLHWTRNRERGRMPSGIRAAMLLVAREALAHEDAQAREIQRQFAELCGPEAYARNNGLCRKCGHPEACAAMGCKTPNVEAKGPAACGRSRLSAQLGAVAGEGRWN